MSPSILMIAAPERFRDEELLIPREYFLSQGFKVTTVSTQTGTGSGMLGHTETFTQTVEEINPTSYDALVVVGGMGAIDHLWNSQPVRQALQAAGKAGKLITAICISPVVLAKAGLLQGKKATVWETAESLAALEQGGAIYTGELVTVDGRIITGNGPEAAQAFAQAVVAALKIAV